MDRRILFIDHDCGRSGSTVSMIHLLRGFVNHGYDVFVLTPKSLSNIQGIANTGAKPIKYGNNLIRTIQMDIHFVDDFSLLNRMGLFRLCKNFIRFVYGLIIVSRAVVKYNPRIIYLNEYVLIQASIVAFFFRMFSVTHIRSLMVRGHWGIRRKFFSKIILNCNQKIFAITEIEARQLNANRNQSQKVFVIPEFFSNNPAHSENTDEIKASFNIPQDKIIVTMLGGILDIKGSMEYLKAAIEISSRYSNVIFVLAGKEYNTPERAEYYEQCMHIIEKLKQTNSIITLGEITNSLKLVNASDVIVSPSPETHFSRPVIEAWGFEKSVVVAETEHAKNLIINEVNGLLFPPFDHVALSDCLRRLIESQELRIKLGENGKKLVLEKFDAEKNIETIINQCDSLLSLDK